MALRDWVSGAVATATVATTATKATPKDRSVATVATVAVAEPRKREPAPTPPRTIEAPTGGWITPTTVYQGHPTKAAVDVADAILTHLANQGRPCTEAEIIQTVGGDPRTVGAILRRLAEDGIVEPVPAGRYRLPEYPPPPGTSPGVATSGGKK